MEVDDVAELADIWVWELDQDYRFTYIAESFLKKSGLPREAIIGRSLVNIKFNSSSSDDSVQIRQAFSGRKPIKNQLWKSTMFGPDPVWLRLSAEPVFGANTEFAGYRGTCVDVTEIVQAQAALGQAHRDLEQKVEQRTKDLDQANQALEREIAGRRETEAALRQSESRLFDAIESIPIGFALYDGEDRLVLHNTSYREVYAKHADAFIEGAKFEDMLRAGVDRGEFAEAIGREEEWIAARVHSHQNPGDVIEQKLSDGRWLQVEELRTSDGGIVGLRTDVTALKMAEQLAARNSERLLEAIESISEGFILFDANEKLVMTNSRFKELYPVVADAIKPGMTLDDFVQLGARRRSEEGTISDPAAWAETLLREYRSPDEPVERQLGDGRWVIASQHRTKEGGIVGIRTETTERKTIEETIRQSEARFTAVFDNSPTAIMLKDLEGKFILVNHRFGKWFAKPGTSIIGRSSHDIYNKEQADALVAQDQAVLTSNESVDREHLVEFADGTQHTIMTTKFPVYSTDWQTIGVGSISVDVTAEKQAEEGLRQAQKMEAIGQLTGGVAHDFNNLLSVILGNAEMLEDTLGQDNWSVATIIRATLRGSELTQRLLAFSRRQPLQPRPTAVGTLVAGMDELLRRTLGEVIELRFNIEPGLANALVDPGQLENGILNLALNARDVMPDGGILSIDVVAEAYRDLELEGTDVIAAEDYVVVRVRDTGTGMSDEVLDRAIEPFFTTKDVGEGSGLGLSMVYGFVKQSGGEILIKSEIDIGTTVELYLPRTVEMDDKRSADAVAMPPRGNGEVILVVEDDRDVGVLVTAMLEGLGYRIVLVANAAAALKNLANLSADLMLSDVVLPGGTSGSRLAQQVGVLYPDLKVLFMSGYAEGVINQTTQLPDGARILNKPFHLGDLARNVRQMLEQ